MMKILVSLIFKALISTSLILMVPALDGQIPVNQFVYGQLEDEMESATKSLRQYTRSTERLTEVAKVCNSRANSGDFSMTSTCDSILQKYNIEMGQFYKENQPIIEELIYPYPIPVKILYD